MMEIEVERIMVVVSGYFGFHPCQFNLMDTRVEVNNEAVSFILMF